MYEKFKPWLFKLDAESSHDLTIKALSIASKSSTACNLIRKYCKTLPGLAPVKVMGLNFPNRIGLAAGLDKHAQCIDAFAAMGFGFVETGTVTPLPQPGNEKPRLFRLTDQQAIINRMGFNSVGLDQFIKNFNRHKTDAVVGINLGKNAATPLSDAPNDYVTGMQRTYAIADYLTINLSSPNTKQLRQLQRGKSFELLVMLLKREQTRLADKHGKYTPLAIKIAPDLEQEGIEDIAYSCLQHNVDAIIATNTTVKRDMIDHHPLAAESGGLSGPPVKALSTQVLQSFSNILKDDIPIIAAGGISSIEDAQEKIDAGASLIQIYTGLIYKGPDLVRELSLGLNDK